MPEIKPFFACGGVTIYHGDCREVLPCLGLWADVIITDPVWPNALPSLAGANDPFELLQQAASYFPGCARRVVVQMGETSDPRILGAIPSELKFLRVCSLDFKRPIRLGRILYRGDVAYVFGSVPKSMPGKRVLSGWNSTKYIGRTDEHPCPRQAGHVEFLVRTYAEGLVLDPFMGRGTTLSAALKHNLPSIGIEVEERYCEIAAKRLMQEAANA